MQSEVDQVVQVILTLYSPSTPSSLASQLQHHLQLVQSSLSAWSLVSPLISHPDPSVRFFAASTLQNRISRGWDTLPVTPLQEGEEGLPREFEELKHSLLTWLAQSAAAAFPPSPSSSSQGHQPVVGEKPVLRKLTAAATALSLRLEGQWKDWLLEVVVKVAGGGAGREASLEVLAVAIEEVSRAELVGSKRMAYMSSLSSTTPHLVSTLSSSLTSPSPSEINSALFCFVSYLNAGQLSHPELTTLYPLFLPHLSNPLTVIAACTAVEELIERSSGLSGSSGVTKFINRQRTNELVEGWANSAFVVKQVLPSALSDAEEGSEPDDEALAVFKLLTTLSEHFITLLFDPRPASSLPTTVPPPLSLTSPATHRLLTTLLTLSTFPGHTPESYSVNELPVASWLALQEYGGDEGLIAGEGDGREGRTGREEDWGVYRAVWEAVASGVVRRGRWPAEEEVAAWPKDLRDAFRVYRSTVLTDTLQYSYFVLRDSLIGTLVSLASSELSSPSSPSSPGMEGLEAILFALFALGEVVPLSPSLSEGLAEENAPPTPLTGYLKHLFSPSVLGALPSSSSSEDGTSHLILRSTALRLVGAYAPWFSAHPEECLGAITFVVSALSSPSPPSSSSSSSPLSSETDLTPRAARALKALCDSNRRLLTSHVSSFVAVLGGLEGKIDDAELAKVLESVASVVQALQGEEEIEPLLTLAGPVVRKMGEAIEGAVATPEDSRLLLLQQLLYLTALSRGLSEPDGDLLDLDASLSLDDSSVARIAMMRVLEDPRVGELRDALGRAVEGAARGWGADVEVVTALSDYIRISTSDSLPSPLALPPLLLLSLSSTALQLSPSSVWLGIMGQLVARLARDKSDTEMGEDVEEMRKIGEPVEKALGVVLGGFGDVAAMCENPDVVAAFLSFCSQIIRNYPRIFSLLPPHYLDAVLAFAERGLEMQEQFSLKSTLELLLSSIQQTAMSSPSSSTFLTVLPPRLTSLLSALLSAIAGAVPRSHLTALSEVLHAALLRLGEPARRVLRELLGREGWPNERAGRERKERFERAVLAARTGKQVRQAVNDFALVCRGLEGTAYGAATM
ncbi:hypothetical protein JCM8547_006333 [Rhodosporidiobolus lusitaniae]